MKYTDSHEWIEMESADTARMGITPYAQNELGDIVYVELPTAGRQINARQEVAVLESTKAAADVYSPVTGVIAEVNTKLANAPELINRSPDQEGWICKIRLSNPAELDLLMSKEEYQAMLNGA